MVVGAFAAMVPAPGAMSAVGDRGSKAATDVFGGEAISIFDSFENEQEILRPEGTLFAEQETVDMLVETDSMQDEPLLPTESNGRIEVTNVEPVQGTRSPGSVDAGGPYGGPDIYEGTTITLTATVDDLALMFYRWDVNGDGVMDTGWRFSPGGSDSYDVTYNDNFFGELITVEAWDGVSTTTIIHSGDVLDGLSLVNAWHVPMISGWLFKAKAPMTISELGWYRYSYDVGLRELTLWDSDTKSPMASCIAGRINYRWNWCTLSAPVTLVAQQNYVMSIVKTDDGPPHYNPERSWAYVDADILDSDYWTIEGQVYRWASDGYGYPSTGPFQTYLPLLDFRWRWVEIQEVTVSDTAFLEVNNVAPEVLDIQTDPAILLEGTPGYFSAQFNDPGIDDEWLFRWDWGGGEYSEWTKVWKKTGGAKILILHTQTTGDGPSMMQAFRDVCPVYCVVIDELRFGPYGDPPNTAPSLAQLLPYDIVVVNGNYIIPIPTTHAVGDVLADYMDQGGNVITMEFSVSTYYGDPTEVGGRFVSDEYTPVVPGDINFNTADLGTIYVPGHQMFDGVTSIRTRDRGSYRDVTTDAIRIADWDDDIVLAAEKTNPIVDNGAIAFTLNWFPLGWATSGDHLQAWKNVVMYITGNNWPVDLTWPAWTTPMPYSWPDDHPTTTSPSDSGIPVGVEIMDDDHLRLKGGYYDLIYEDCEGYSYPAMPPGWSSSPGYYGTAFRIYNEYYTGSDAAFVERYYYRYNNRYAYLWSPGVDTSGIPWVQATLSFQYAWITYNYPQYPRWVTADISADGGATWTTLLYLDYDDGLYDYNAHEFSTDVLWAMGDPDVRLRFTVYRAYRYAYYMFAVDEVHLEAAWGAEMWGLGTGTGEVTVANVEPTIHGGPTSGYLTESGIMDLFGYRIADPALLEPTEWFAYKWDFDDGTGTDWNYKGSLAPPKMNVLLLHSWDYGGTGGESHMRGILSNVDLVDNVESWNFFETWEVPTLSYMLDFDIIIVGTSWAWVSPAWEAHQRLVGDRLADYLDSGRGSVIASEGVISDHGGYGNVFRILGRFDEEQYAPFEDCDMVYPAPVGLGEIHEPNHQIMKDKYVVEEFIANYGYPHTSDCPTTPGGLRIASWDDDGAAIGVKEQPNGAKVAYFGASFQPGYVEGDLMELFRNGIAHAYGAFIPDERITDISHAYGDNGVYYPTISVIDDDMGYTWDMANNEPVADPRYTQSMTNYAIPISVDNVEPTLHAMRAYTDVELCIRMTGNKGNMATLTLIGSDGTYATATAVRVPGNPAIACLDPMEIEMSMGTTYEVSIFYDPADDDGANPVWTFSAEFPKGKIKELKTEFHSEDGPTTVTIGNKAFKRMAIGAPITFEAFADDPGSDDLAFVWVWGPEGVSGSAYDIHIWAHPGYFVTASAYMNPADLPFPEPDFDKALNDIRSPEVDPIRVTDIATHSFDEGMFGNGPITPWYVYLLVMDDDVDDNYPSLYGHHGVDMDFLVLDW